LLPAIIGDRALLQDALVTLIRGALAGAAVESKVRVQADRDGRMIRFAILGVGAPAASVRRAAAARVILAHGGRTERGLAGLWIELPIAGPDG
jgi:hypothetical protein